MTMMYSRWSREARVISPGVLANSSPQEASKNRYGEGLEEVERDRASRC